MFDTVKIGVPLMLTEQEVGNIEWTRTNSSYDKSRNQTTPTIFKVLQEKEHDSFPFIRYTYKSDDPTQCWLKIEVSIPNFICGSNVYEVKESDLENFYKVLRKYIAVRLKLDLSRVPKISQCILEKVHVCKNFNVGLLKDEYLKAMASFTMAKYQQHLYCSIGSNNIESVEWKSKKRKEKIYDKEAEVKQKKDYPGKPDHLKRAKGLIRYEIELTDKEIRQISPARKVGEVLREGIANQILQKGLERNGLSDGIKYSSLHQVINKIYRENLPLRTKTSLIAFVTIWLVNGEDECRNKYTPSNYWKIKKEIKEILGVDELLIGEKVLPPLNVLEKQKKTATVLGKQ
ncbi:hypothetical protein P9265_16765 [Schinkia azotoformans]|uniref:hypothetical protein n=1 Tax=Schinkia azotoformans TaxID=1454 RepID=UPI002E214771|nr:hypothetical protein [Schinkia azotoformans]